MNPIELVPVADSLTATNGWFQFFLMLTFPLHLLAMNAMLGTALIAFIGHLYPDQHYNRLSHELAKVLPFLVAFTVNLGVAPLLFVNVIYGHLLYTSTVMMGLFWLSIIPVLITAYYLAYIYDFNFKRLGNLTPLFTLVVLALLMLVGFMFSNNMTMMLSPSSWLRWFDTPGGTLLNLSDPTLIPRYIHTITGSLAVGGLLVALYAKTLLKKDDELSQAGQRLGMRLFAWLTLLQFGIGSWYLVSLPSEITRRFMGGDTFSTALLALGLLLAAATLHTGFKRLVIPSVLLSLPLVYLMAFLRDSVRAGYIAPYFDPSSVAVKIQWSPLVFFLITLLFGIGLIVWMLLLVRKMEKAG